MKKKILKISAFCIALILIGFVLSFANSLVGNPISAALARNTAKTVIKTEYPDTDYQLERVSFNFKDGNYYAYVTSESNMDGDFTPYINMLGQLTYNDHDYRVDGKSNVSRRLDMEYREAVERVLRSSTYPYYTELNYGELEFSRNPEYFPLPENAVKIEDLENNKLYNVSDMGKTNGKIVLYVEVDDVNFEKAAEVLLKTRELLEKSGVYFYSIDFVLEYPPFNEDTYERPDENVRVEDFLCSDIYEEGLAERIEKADAEVKARYAEADAEKAW